jgi:hypothetical protein
MKTSNSAIVFMSCIEQGTQWEWLRVERIQLTAHVAGCSGPSGEGLLLQYERVNRLWGRIFSSEITLPLSAQRFKLQVLRSESRTNTTISWARE